MLTPQPLRATMDLTREQLAQIEVSRTAVAPATARGLVALFLMSMATASIVEWAGVPALRATGTAPAWSHMSSLPAQIRAHLRDATRPRRSGQARRLLPGEGEPAGASEPGVWPLVLSTNRVVLAGLRGFERGLESESLLGRRLRPPAQAVMTRWLGAGNERVYPGRDRWLFYRPDVEYVTGRGFLDPGRLRQRVATAPEGTVPPQPDPRQALLRFRDDLEARGITLVVMPTPVKPGVHPEMLARRYADAKDVLRNPSFGVFVDALRRDGVLVFDPSDPLAVARPSGPQYLATDTHWRPEAMEAVAELLGRFITAHVALPPGADPGYRIERTEVRNTGDVARMLDLPDGDTRFPPEAVSLRRVLQADGSPWRPSRAADVLLLGDSFSNIYTLRSLGWGTSAGLAEQLSYSLGRPVDRHVQNDEGAFAPRAALRQDPGRLDGKRVVVYQFVQRELAFGDWKLLPLPAP